MERKGVLPVKSGISRELLKETAAQYATILSGLKPINQQTQRLKKDDSYHKHSGGWDYNNR